MGRRAGDRKAEEEPIVVSMGDDDNAASRPSGSRAAGWRPTGYTLGSGRGPADRLTGGGTWPATRGGTGGRHRGTRPAALGGGAPGLRRQHYRPCFRSLVLARWFVPVPGWRFVPVPGWRGCSVGAWRGSPVAGGHRQVVREPLAGGGRLERAAEAPALRGVAPHGRQRRRHLGRLHAFGHRPDPQGPDQPHQRPDDLFVVGHVEQP